MGTTVSVDQHIEYQNMAHTIRVVVIDDQSTGRLILSEIVRSVDPSIDVISFADPLEALEHASTHAFDMVLTDYKMPTLDGIETVRRLRKMVSYEEVPIVIVTIVGDLDIRRQALEAGATDFLTRPIDRIECRTRIKNLLALRRHQILNQQRRQLLENKVNEVTKELRLREIETLLRLARAAEQRDKTTGQHVTRMAKYSALLAQAHGLPEAMVEMIEMTAPMHDIGKVGIPDDILLSPRKLTVEEFEVMKTHTSKGYELLKDSASTYVQMAAQIALNHHEKFDGSGYPAGLSGHAIPLVARIVAIADVFDALTSVRPYKKAWSIEETCAYLIKEKGRHFDPELVDLFIAQSDAIDEIGKLFADQANS